MGFSYIPSSGKPLTYGVLGGYSGNIGSGSVAGSINFDFTTGSLPAGITFTRASIGTYNSSGNILTTASNNVARFNYVAGVANLLIEGSATNLFLQSNAFTTTWTAWGGSVITPAQFVSPDGTNNGWTITAAGGGINQILNLSNVPYIVSIWGKYIIGTSDLRFSMNGIDVGSLVQMSATLTRIYALVTPNAGSGNQVIYNNGANPTDGIYGAQLELGSKLTSYIPTTTAAVTRQADSATFTVPTGINQLVFTFDDNSTQTVAVTPGSYTIPTNLSRPNIKSVVGRYAFDFTSGSLPAGMTFTRPSIGTYTNAGGTLITAGNDVARMNYVSGVSCLLIEGSATNLVLQSNNFSNAAWTMANGPTLTAAQFISPDGANNGWTVTGSASTGMVYGTATYSAIPYVMSIWAKRISGPSGLGLWIQDNAVSGSSFATTSTLTRYSGSRTPLAGPFNYIVVAWTATDTHGIYGAQVETGTVATSYIPTTTAAVTRAADSAVFTIPSGVGHLTYTFDDNTTQLVTVSAGSYTIPTTLNRPNIKSIVGSA